jgi:hypothetical protein
VGGWNYNLSQTGGSFFEQGQTGPDGFATVTGLIAGQEYCVSHDDYNDREYVNSAPVSHCVIIQAGQTTPVAFTTEIAPGELDIVIYGTADFTTANWPISVQGAGQTWNVVTNENGEVYLPVPGGFEYCATPGAPPPGYTGTTPASGCIVVPPGSNNWIEFQSVALPPPSVLGVALIDYEPPGQPYDFTGVTFIVRHETTMTQYTLTANASGYAQLADAPYGFYCLRDWGGMPAGTSIGSGTYCIDHQTTGSTIMVDWYEYSAYAPAGGSAIAPAPIAAVIRRSAPARRRAGRSGAA